MKLHLPFSLRKALFALFAVSAVQPAMAASMSTLVSHEVYCDFGDNAGLYSVHGVNDLLEEIRRQDEGIYIYYTKEGLEPYNILVNEGQELISFESRTDRGPSAGIGYNFVATVQHNGLIASSTFTATKIGTGNAIQYASIEYASSTDNMFTLTPRADYKIVRLSKVITDVSTYGVYTDACSSLDDKIRYRSGSGNMYRVDESGKDTVVAGAYTFNTGGIMQVDSASNYDKYLQVEDYRKIKDDSGSILNSGSWWHDYDITGKNYPLPYAVEQGDSGSPTWVYDAKTQTYLYAGAMQSNNDYNTLSQARYAGQWTQDTMDYFSVNIDLEGDEGITIGAASNEEPGKYDAVNKVTSKPYSGTVQVEGKDGAISYLGVNSAVSTWNSLSGKINADNWYAYDSGYLNKSLTHADLFYTQDLVFNGQGGQQHEIFINGNVDTGIGYARFVNTDAEASVRVTYTVTGAEGSMFNTAGFVVEKGVDLHVELTGQENYAREWRKIGEGDLYIEGTGDNHEILLNLGGSGTTYLNRQNGYAAYNVLANNGTTVVLEREGQIKRDFTFGFGGATLDFKGKSMTWTNGNGIDAPGFTIHALTDEARITNSAENTTTKLEWTQSGTNLEYLGSFVDTDNGGALQFIYDGGTESKLTLHSIYTDLHNTANGEKSGIIVRSGTLVLQGTVTKHAPGSRGVQLSNAALVNNNDWHYADMKAPVTVESGASFELGSHARLIGDVTVESNGSFVMREGVAHQMEYMEGSYTTRNTDNYRAYFGLTGNVSIGQGATMKIEFNTGADSRLVYDGDISGTGSLIVNPGIEGGLVQLGGNNANFSGAKSIQHGGVIFTSVAALGDVNTNKWKLEDSGYMTSSQFEEMSDAGILSYIDEGSTGVLALTDASRDRIDLTTHSGLIIGAAEGKTVQYGTAGTDATLEAWDGSAWHLGGGGGTLVVNYKLTGDKDLVLGDKYTKGSVYLTNQDNDFSGKIVFNGGMTLLYDSDDVLGDASFSVSYSNRVAPRNGLAKVEKTSTGVLLLDKMAQETTSDGTLVLRDDLDLQEYTKLAIGASVNTEIDGTILVANNEAYRFGGATALVTVKSALAAKGRNNLVVDGQTYSGGEIRLDTVSEITGDVVVCGYDQTASTPPCEPIGNITLGLTQNNALAQAASVRLKDGGYMELYGTNQQFKNLSVASGASLVDSSDALRSELTIEMTEGQTWAGIVNVKSIDVNGSGTLTLAAGSSVHYEDLHLGSGTALTVASDSALNAVGTTYVAQSATLNVDSRNISSDIEVSGRMNAASGNLSGLVTLRDNGSISFAKGTLESGGALVSYGGTITGLNASLEGDCYFLENETVYSIGVDQQKSTSYIRGHVEIADGASLKLKYGYVSFIGLEMYYEYGISSSEFNTATHTQEDGTILPNGTLYAETARLHLQGGNQNFGGTVKIGNHNTVISNNAGTKTFDTFQLTGGTTSANSSGNVYWTINHLNGNGTFNVNINKQLSLTGNGNFNGVLNKSGGSLLLGHEDAAASAEVRLSGAANLILAADTLKVRALSGTDATASLVAGGSEATQTSRNATLQIDGTDGNSYTYAGSVKGDAVHGISLVKNGASTQIFSNDAVALKDVTVNAGTLGFSGSISPQIHGNLAVAQGAELDMYGKELLLGPEQSFSVLTGADPTTEATLGGNLVFNGGSLVLSGAAVAQAGGNGILQLGTASRSSGTTPVVVNFTDERTLNSNNQYILSSGDWSSISGPDIVTDSLIYHEAVFETSASSLKVTFSDRTDILVWNGTASKNQWDDSHFGQHENGLPSGHSAVFNDDATFSNVSVNGHVEAKELIFDNNANSYTLIAGSNAGVQAERLRQTGAGSTTLLNGISADSVEVQAGTLNLGRGSSVGNVTVEEAGTVVLKDNTVATGTISGDGTVQVDWGKGNSGSVSVAGIGTLDVKSGSVDMAAQDAAQMNTLHVSTDASYSTTSVAGNFADKAIVDEGGTLTITIGAVGTSGSVAELSGAGTVALVNSQKVDLGNSAPSGGTVNASGFHGTLNLGGGSGELRYASTNLSGLAANATIELQGNTQFWVKGANRTVDADLVLHGESGAAKGNSWNGEGFGAVRGAKVINGDVTIDGNAMLSDNEHNSVTFNGIVKSYNENGGDTLTLGCYFNNNGMTYTFAEGSDASGLDNIVLRRSGADGTGQGSILNVESNKGLAKNVEFAAGTTDGAQVNVNAAASADTLKSANGDGVVNIAQGASLALNQGADFGGTVNMSGGAVTVTANAAGTVFQAGPGVQFATGDEGLAGISGDGTTRMDNTRIQMQGNDLRISNIILGAGSTIAANSSTLEADNLVIEGQLGGNVNPGTAWNFTSGSVLTASGNSAETITLSAPAQAAVYVLNNLQDVALTGECLTIDLSNTGQSPLPGEWMGITLGGDSHTASFDTGLLVECIMGNGQKLQGYYLSSSSAGSSPEYVFFKGEEVVAGNLVWDHATNTNWSTKGTDLNWHTVDQPETHQAFTANSNVTFESEACTVNLTENISAGDVMLQKGAEVTINGAGYTQEIDNVGISAGSTLNFSENSNTDVTGSVTLNGTLHNEGSLSIAQGTVMSNAVGELGGNGETTLTGSILNAGVMVLKEATMKGEPGASITGNVVIDGGTFSGTLALGMQGSTITIANAFQMEEGAEYTVNGNMVLDDLDPSWILMDGAEYDKENNGFIALAFITVYDTDSEEDPLVFSEGSSVTYKGISGTIFGGEFEIDASDYTTFHVNTSDLGMELYSTAKTAAEKASCGDDFKNVRLAAGTGFKMDSEGAALDKVTVDEGEEAAVLAITESASVGTVEMGADFAITGNSDKALQIGSVRAASASGEAGTLTISGPTVTVASDMANFNGSVDVEAGVLNLLNTTKLVLNDVTIGADATLGVYNSATAVDATAYEGILTIRDAQSLTAEGPGSTLNANLVMESGSLLDVHGTEGTGLTLSGALTLNKGINLSESDLAAIMGLRVEDTYNLFNSVDALTLSVTQYDKITPELRVDAAEWFHGIDPHRMYMVYDGDNVGVYCMYTIPEPATGTLSLLALAALAARRRRRK